MLCDGSTSPGEFSTPLIQQLVLDFNNPFIPASEGRAIPENTWGL
jgi:hypothetical protein